MITTKKVGEISKNTLFFIPDYQRGYKWTTEHVKQLLIDIIDFEENSSTNLNQSYCLQPIVLKKIDKNDKRLQNAKDLDINEQFIVYELIDGQQRLTTILLILAFLNQRFKPEFATETFQLFYQTRDHSFEFLRKISQEGISTNLEKESKKNIDFHHIYQGYKSISNFFTNEEEKKDINLFESTLLYRTKFIWYVVDQEESSTAEAIFKRLNSGKVELTNAELIKALLLGKFNEGNISETERQQISIEWEWIDNELNHNEFWYFITNKKWDKNNRIAFLLDYYADKNDSFDFNKDDKRYTFLVFNKLLQSNNSKKDIWDVLKEQFRLLHNWYSDYELFHYIGFLLSDYVQRDLNNIFNIYRESKGLLSDFKTMLKEEIDGEVNHPNLNDLSYPKDYHLIKKILLWFNISKMLKDENRNHRFNFFKFKYHNYDLEHIRSLKSDITKSDKSKNEFLKSIFNFYSNQNLELVSNQTEIIKNEHYDVLVQIYQYMQSTQRDNFNDIYISIKTAFDLEDDEIELSEDNSIGNLCLLDQGTNRSYKNAIFPIKRQTIIDRDLKGTYILPMTKSAFLKQFNGRSKNLLVWTKADSVAYKEEIINAL